MSYRLSKNEVNFGICLDDRDIIIKFAAETESSELRVS